MTDYAEFSEATIERYPNNKIERNPTYEYDFYIFFTIYDNLMEMSINFRDDETLINFINAIDNHTSFEGVDTCGMRFTVNGDILKIEKDDCFFMLCKLPRKGKFNSSPISDAIKSNTAFYFHFDADRL
jgi:hypothetical protein